ncbi:protein Diedel-like [Drosophila innubila]|uniref:protein Diedel-like n=1 Tax=Drosophila innubila TaxID=198719 RepID=UPI00148E2519|nr:protein Diedel-like [Drosophila innubila]
MRYLGLVFFLLVAMQPWRTGDTECCTGTYTRFGIKPKDDCNNYAESNHLWFTDSCWKWFCGNLTAPSPCCGVGSCNIFCCNCDDGCIRGSVVGQLMERFGSNITMITPEPKKPIIFKYDTNKTETVNNETVVTESKGTTELKPVDEEGNPLLA